MDVCSRRILGWRTGTSMRTALVLDALEMAIWTRGRHGTTDLAGLVHHNDAASRARGHFPNEPAALTCVYLAVMALNPTGAGRRRWTIRCKPALHAFDLDPAVQSTSRASRS